MRRSLKLAAFLTALSALCSPGIPDLSVPIRGLQPADLRDMFHEVHNGHAHEAIDLMEPRGTPVLAVAPGAIRKLFLSKPGGNTIYQFDQTDTFCYYYAHLDRYADNVREGMRVKAGDVLGYVGSTGNANANAPHLHFAIFALGPKNNGGGEQRLTLTQPWLRQLSTPSDNYRRCCCAASSFRKACSRSLT